MMLSPRLVNNVLLRPSSRLSQHSSSLLLHTLPSWATLDPSSLGSSPTPYVVSNIVNGTATKSSKSIVIPNPLDKDSPPVCTVPDTEGEELRPFIESLRGVPKSGVHNPLKNVHRYLEFGEISRKVSGQCFFGYSF